MENLLIPILLLPLGAFFIQILFGSRIPRGGDWISTAAILASFYFAVRVFLGVWEGGGSDFHQIYTWSWLALPGFSLNAGMWVDSVTAVMLIVVTLVSGLIHIYSVGYMHGDPRYSRYYAYLSLFSFSMLGIVLTDSLFFLYVFWELVGISSYLLIGFWFEKPEAASAGKKAFITTRIGDVGMFIGIMMVFAHIGHVSYAEFFSSVANGAWDNTLLTIAGILLFMGAVGKSAQFPLHVWLPDAMEGPTPVSALIHAATMVAAGVYMVARLFVVFTPDALLVIAYIGAITAFFAATIAIVMTDIKRVLAYSTLSQLGYMMMALGVGGYVAGMFHLMTHAFFKALLFLGAGSVIHAMHTNEITEMGGLRKKMPATFLTFLAATMAISGVPFFSGFYSKDAILASALAFGLEEGHMLLFLMAIVAAGITAFYMFRLVFVTFTGKPRNKDLHDHAHESPLVMTIPLVVLAILSISSAWGGWFERFVEKPDLMAYATVAGVKWESRSPDEDPARGIEKSEIPKSKALRIAREEFHRSTVSRSQAEHGESHDEHDSHGAHTTAMILSIIVAGTGIFLSYLTYQKKSISSEVIIDRFRGIHRVLSNKYYVDEFYQKSFIGMTLLISRISGWFDLYIIDGIVNGVSRLTTLFSAAEGRFDLKVIDGMVNGVAGSFIFSGKNLRRIQTGRIQNYLVGLLVGVIVIFLFRVI
jgi:NADH-quinone oxidoreductase subunit L